MDHNHKLDAPNEQALENIEQIQDRSDLTGIYREPGKQFEGELLSAEDRDKAKAEEVEAITSGLGRSALRIGLYVPYPFISGLLLAVGLYTWAQTSQTMVMAILIVLSGAFWVITSYKAYAAIYKIFYKHALRAGPFLVVALVTMILAAQAIFGFVVDGFSTDSLIFNAALMSLLLLMYSLIVTYILLGIWGNSRLNSGVKVLVSGLIILVSGFLVISTYLF
jgi:hypothetical protein